MAPVAVVVRGQDARPFVAEPRYSIERAANPEFSRKVGRSVHEQPASERFGRMPSEREVVSSEAPNNVTLQTLAVRFDVPTATHISKLQVILAKRWFSSSCFCLNRIDVKSFHRLHRHRMARVALGAMRWQGEKGAVTRTPFIGELDPKVHVFLVTVMLTGKV